MSELKDIIAEGENSKQCFLVKISDFKKSAHIFNALSNTKGGRLLIGVKENGKIVGCYPEEELEHIDKTIELYCVNKLNYNSKIWQEDFRLVLEINILESDNKPEKVKGEDNKLVTFVRVNTKTIIANKIFEGIWKKQKEPLSEKEILDPDDLSLLKIIQTEQAVTISKLYRISNLPLSKVDNSIIKLVFNDLIEMKLEKDIIVYIIKRNSILID